LKKHKRTKKLRRYNLYRSILLKLMIKKLLKNKLYYDKYKNILYLIKYGLETKNTILLDLFFINLRYRYRKLSNFLKKKNNKILNYYKIYNYIYYKRLKRKKLINRMVLIRKKFLKKFKILNIKNKNE